MSEPTSEPDTTSVDGSTTPTTPLPSETATTGESGSVVSATVSNSAEDSSAASDESSKPRKLYRDDFTWGEVIGEGAYGEVQIATVKETGISYAVKILNKKHIIAQKKVAWVNREKVLLDRLRHPNIVDLFYTFSDPDNLHVVLELCPNGELLDQIKRHGCLSMTCTKFCIAEIISACEFMHMIHGVAHRDVKPENILIGNGGHMKFVDFGTAKELGVDRKARSKSFVGTAEYVSPELLRDKEAGLAADLWAVGCMVYQLLTGRPPFRAPNEYLTFQKILNRTIIYPVNFPETAKDLLDGLLEMDPDKRLGFRDPGGYEELKSHPFFEGIDWATLSTMTPPPFEPPAEMPIWPEKEDDKPESTTETTANPTAATLTSSGGSTPSANSSSENNSTSTSTSTTTSTSSSENDDDKKSSERASKLEQQKSSPWAQFLRPDELILHNSLITKKKGFFARKRQLVLTDGPRLFYIDPDKMVVKGEIPWGTGMSVEFKNDKLFVVNVPGRAYRLGELSGEARKWVDVLQPLLS